MKQHSLTEFKKHIRITITEWQKQLQLLEQKEAQWEEAAAKIEQNAKKASEKVVLDVGGQTFATCKETMTAIEGSYFDVMVTRWASSDGHYFIDRSPDHFERILDYLRTKIFYIDDLTPHEQAKLEEDFEYFHIPYPPPKVKVCFCEIVLTRLVESCAM